MDDLSTKILGSIVRHALTAAGGYLVAHGVINSSDAASGVGAAMTMIGIGWAAWQKYEVQKAAADEAAAHTGESKG